MSNKTCEVATQAVVDALGVDVSALRPASFAAITRGAWVVAVSESRIHVGRAVAYGTVAITVDEETFAVGDRFYEIEPLVESHRPSWIRRVVFGEKVSSTEFSPSLRQAVSISAVAEKITSAHAGRRIVIESVHGARLVTVKSVLSGGHPVVVYDDTDVFGDPVERRESLPCGAVVERLP